MVQEPPQSIVKDETDDKATIVYPNPVRNILQIKGLHENAVTILSIIDTNGKILNVTRVTANSYNWNVGNLKAGAYYIRIQQKENNNVLRFIKE